MSDAQLAETSCDLGGPREGLFAAECLWARRPASEDVPLMRQSGLAMKSFAFDCESWPRNGGGSAIGVLV